MELVELNVRLKDDKNILNRLVDLGGKPPKMVGNEPVVKVPSSKVVKDFSNRPGPRGLSEDVKVGIGTLASFVPQKDVAKLFGVSQALVSDYSKGITSSSDVGSFDVSLKSKVDENVGDVKKKISDLALSKLTKALESMTDDMFANEKLVNLSVVAGNLSKIGKVGFSDDSIVNNTANQFVFYAPRNKNEDEYDVVEVSS